MAAVLAASTAAAVGVGATPALASGSSPSVTIWPSAVPIVGGVLSDASDTPTLSIKDGWSIYDPDGVCSANAQLYNNGWSTVWTSSGNASTTTVTGKTQWTARVGGYSEVDVNATDCLGNTGSGYDYVEPSLDQQGAASYSAGWSTSSCTCFSGGSVLKSTKVGAKADYSFNGRMVTLIGEKAANRGKASLYIDGVFKKTINLYAASSSNRVVVWNSPYLSNGSHTLTVKVASGRVDIDGFMTN